MQLSESAHTQLKPQDRLSIKLLQFYANEEKDSVTARCLIEKLKVDAKKNNYNDQRKCFEFFLTLREDAVAWWTTLKHEDIKPIH